MPSVQDRNRRPLFRGEMFQAGLELLPSPSPSAPQDSPSRSLPRPAGTLLTAFLRPWPPYIWVPLCAVLTVGPGILLSQVLGQVLNWAPILWSIFAGTYAIPMFIAALVLVRVAAQQEWSLGTYLRVLIIMSVVWASLTAGAIGSVSLAAPAGA